MHMEKARLSATAGKDVHETAAGAGDAQGERR
jgi:hypothetical protein